MDGNVLMEEEMRGLRQGTSEQRGGWLPQAGREGQKNKAEGSKGQTQRLQHQLVNF
jgi:hypothetical protein